MAVTVAEADSSEPVANELEIGSSWGDHALNLQQMRGLKGRSAAVITMLHVIAGEARIYCTTGRTALGDGVRGARSRLARDASVGHHVHALVRGRREPFFDGRNGRVLLRAGDRHHR